MGDKIEQYLWFTYWSHIPYDERSRFSRKKFHSCCCLYSGGLSPGSQGCRERGCRFGLCWSLEVAPPRHTASLHQVSPLHVPFSVSLLAALISTFLSRWILSPGVFPALPTSPQRRASVLEDPLALAVCLRQPVQKAGQEGAQTLRTWAAGCSGLGVPRRCLREAL